jgi:hypothetical protein
VPVQPGSRLAGAPVLETGLAARGQGDDPAAAAGEHGVLDRPAHREGRRDGPARLRLPLIIAGSTGYDVEAGLTSWQQIAAYWVGTDDYLTRVGNLTTGNDVPLLDPATVTGNGGGNTLTGNGALALLYTDGADNITGFDPSSQQVTITP